MKEPKAPPDCLYYLLTRASLVATSMLKRALVKAGADRVRPAYLGALMTLWEEDGLQVTELARRAGLEPSTTTGLVDRMEGEGLIVREQDPGDRRALRIRLTERGRSIRPVVMAVVDETLAKGTEGLCQEEIEVTKRALTRFLGNVQRLKRER